MSLIARGVRVPRADLGLRPLKGPTSGIYSANTFAFSAVVYAPRLSQIIHPLALSGISVFILPPVVANSTSPLRVARPTLSYLDWMSHCTLVVPS